MTWNELKTYVDQELLTKGEKGDIEIWYIDITFPTNIHPPVVEIYEEGKTLIMSDLNNVKLREPRPEKQ